MSLDSSPKGSTGFEKSFSEGGRSQNWKAGALRDSFSRQSSGFSDPNAKMSNSQASLQTQANADMKSNPDQTHLQKLTNGMKFSVDKPQAQVAEAQNKVRTANGVDNTNRVEQNAVKTANEAKAEMAAVVNDIEPGAQILSPEQSSTMVGAAVNAAMDVIPIVSYGFAALDIAGNSNLGSAEKERLIKAAHEQLVAAQNPSSRSGASSVFSTQKTTAPFEPPRFNWANLTSQEAQDFLDKPVEELPEIEELKADKEILKDRLEDETQLAKVEDNIPETETVANICMHAESLRDVGGDVVVSRLAVDFLDARVREAVMPSLAREFDSKSLPGATDISNVRSVSMSA